MFRFILVSLAIGVVLFGATAYYFGLFEPESIDPPGPNTAATANVDLGGDLYPVASYPPLAPPTARTEPIILRGHATIKDKQDVPSNVSGQILFIGEAVPDGAIAVAGAAAFMAEPYAYSTVTVGDAKVFKFYRRILPGQIVESEQVVGMIDCSKALATLKEKQIKIEISIKDKQSAKAAADEALSRYTRDKKAFDNNGLSAAELSASYAAKEKFHYDYEAKAVAIDAARNELEQAAIYYRMHEIRNKIPAQRCVVHLIYKHRGDAVKEQETVMVLNSLDELMAEAQMSGSYIDRIQPKMTATIEPTKEESPYPFYGAHKGEVTAVAVTNDVDKPRIVSAGLDRVVSIHDPIGGALPVNLQHDDSVRALACAPPGATHNLCLAGAGNKIVIWDLDRNALGKAPGLDMSPASTIADAHDVPVTCVAFSPDGTYFASGDAEGGIALWQTEGAKLVYRLDSDHVFRYDAKHQIEPGQGHTGAVTALTFTPQCRLISAARDNTIRIWQLKEKGAVTEGQPLTDRSGTVAHLGVRPDGKWLLFDQGNKLHLLSIERHGADFNIILQNPGSSTPFETLALFSPDGTLLLTAGQSDGRLQLWQAPTESTRGFEVRQFTSRERQPATCAAFAPRLAQAGKHSFAVSGSAAGDLYLWPLPTAAQIAEHRIEHVTVRLLGQNLDPTTHQARINVDVPNPVSPQFPNGRLIPGRDVTIVLED